MILNGDPILPWCVGVSLRVDYVEGAGTNRPTGRRHRSCNAYRASIRHTSWRWAISESLRSCESREYECVCCSLEVRYPAGLICDAEHLSQPTAIFGRSHTEERVQCSLSWRWIGSQPHIHRDCGEGATRTSTSPVAAGMPNRRC